ncbi:dinuclear metal center YbgI/SA1388 family protein [Desulfohalotomaculum tongense]|uniref:Nif3-like dinuclear metal center hexameric protein n=1 Tax=Desulforadius tongensis TaxID=1216062 RepID=UPI001959E519|nr:Nif3-like dinuclear metal center hexameric protein [Desulforadius tongensis]MBM7855767.1 dinuclear metal center YbgI/SA1388 family protein [Desulforadius tongensis]
MPVKNKVIFNFLEELAPKHLAEDWDNVGLQIGSPSNEVKKVLLTLDVNEDVVREAEENDIQLIISHHPVLMKGIKNINTDTVQGRLISRLIKNNITVYAAHTNLDSADGGVNSVLAEKLGLKDVEVLYVTGNQKYVKLVVFVPDGYQDAVREALSKSGAGWIGNYSDCTFQTPGVGTFLPREGTNPFIGKQGRVERVEEVRLETIVPVEKLSSVIKAMVSAHPYEEVAYDVYPLNNQGPAYGLGRIGVLPREVSFTEFVQQLKEVLNLKAVKAGGPWDKRVKTVAVCGGSAAELWPQALAKGADVYVSGDIKYHTAQDMVAANLSFVDAGHYGSEVPVIEKIYNYLTACCAEKNIAVDFIISKKQKDPFTYL